MLTCDTRFVDERTLAIKSFYIGEHKSEIFTTHGVYYSVLTPKELLDEACLNFFSTREGRTHAARLKLGYATKSPFIIDPDKYGATPTTSPDNADCVWLFGHRYDLEVVVKGESVVTFKEGTTIDIKASKHTIDRQDQRLHTLLSVSGGMKREKQMYSETPPPAPPKEKE